jgi:hypothetical protein
MKVFGVMHPPFKRAPGRQVAPLVELCQRGNLGLPQRTSRRQQAGSGNRVSPGAFPPPTPTPWLAPTLPKRVQPVGDRRCRFRTTVPFGGRGTTGPCMPTPAADDSTTSSQHAYGKMLRPLEAACQAGRRRRRRRATDVHQARSDCVAPADTNGTDNARCGSSGRCTSSRCGRTAANFAGSAVGCPSEPLMQEPSSEGPRILIYSILSWRRTRFIFTNCPLQLDAHLAFRVAIFPCAYLPLISDESSPA